MIASNHNPLKFSFIIPAWPEEGRPFGLDFIDRLDWPQENLEVLIARGYSPCKQRNHAARQATGDILIFFDNDSCPEPDYLRHLAKHFADPDVTAVGGPNPGLPTKQYVPNLVEAVLTSRIAVLSKTKRYKASGPVREGNDSELIFCNFAIRRDLYLQIGGLDERLCPNEENETLERFHELHPDQKILYDPQLIAYEPRPDTIRAFLRKMYGYGKGRARQCKIRPSAWSFLPDL
jgi:glycosyl transferase family 2